MKKHHLKTWPKFFRAVRSGEKAFEARKNDRDFEVGDMLVLEEYDPDKKEFSGETESREVSYILYGPAFGVEEGHCVMSLSPLNTTPTPPTPTPRVDARKIDTGEIVAGHVNGDIDGEFVPLDVAEALERECAAERKAESCRAKGRNLDEHAARAPDRANQ